MGGSDHDTSIVVLVIVVLGVGRELSPLKERVSGAKHVVNSSDGHWSARKNVLQEKLEK